jgi:hypothetical protein
MLSVMGWLRAGIVGSTLAGAGLLAIGLVDCAEPTQIVVEVYSDACRVSGITRKFDTTGIAVGTPADIDNKAPTTTKEGCPTTVKGGGGFRGVGTLTIYPSGDNDAEIAIKVVTGLDRAPDECSVRDGYRGCIAHRRIMHFVPNTTQRAIIRLSLKCLNINCGAGQTCDEGQCKRDVDLLADGGTVADAQTTEASAPDGAVDAGSPDACTGCSDECVNGECRVDCSKGAGCATTELCAPTLPCVITCGPGNGKCADIHCTTSAKCSVECRGDKSCGKITCNAKDCDVECDGTGSCSEPIVLDASASGDLSCRDDKACVSASCNSPRCEMECQPSLGACPDAGARPCTGGCQKWNDPDVKQR